MAVSDHMRVRPSGPPRSGPRVTDQGRNARPEQSGPERLAGPVSTALVMSSALLSLQQTVGNQAVQRMLTTGVQRQSQGGADQDAGAQANKVQQMTADFDKALQDGDWGKAALILNGFAMFDILPRVEKMTPDQWREVKAAAKQTMAGWEGRVTTAIELVEHHRLLSPIPDGMKADPQGIEIIRRYMKALNQKARLVFGQPVDSIPANPPLRGRFKDKLVEADTEAKIRAWEAGKTVPETAADWTSYGVQSIGSGGGGKHAEGLAVDINYWSAPYIIGESGEQALDKELSAVYARIAGLINKEKSAIPALISDPKNLKPGGRGVDELYDALQKESEAMQRYFGLVKDTEALKKIVNEYFASDFGKTNALRFSTDPDEVKRQIEQDYLILGGSIKQLEALLSGEPVMKGVKTPGVVYKSKYNEETKTWEPIRKFNKDTQTWELIPADRPFQGAHPERKPESGFLSIPREVVEALVAVGLTWGAVGLGGESGDIMHFDLR